MPEVIVLNPRSRRTGRFVRNARRKTRRRRRNPVAALAANPRRRRRRRNPIALANPRRRRRRNPRMYRRRRRNPSMRSLMSVRGITSALMPAAIGGAGALGVDVLLSYVPLPDWFTTTPTGKMVARIAGAFGLGVIASFVTSRRTAMLVTGGALTVTAYGAIRDLAAQQFPQLQGISPAPYGDYSDTQLGYVSPAPRLGAYMQRNAPARVNGMGAYMRDSLDNVNSLAGVTSDGL